METVGALDPKFYLLGGKTISAPKWRTRHLAEVLPRELTHFFYQLFAASQWLALLGDCRTDLTATRAAVKVLVDFRIFQLGHGAFDTYLATKTLPVETQRRDRIFCQFPALSAFRVGEEAETTNVYALYKHHSDAWAACGC